MLTSLKFNDLLLDLSTPKVMGIINLNKDSFFKTSRHSSIDSVSKYIDNSINNGLDIIDLGAFSSRPGAKIGNESEEKERLLPMLKAIRIKYPKIFISVDTYNANIASIALDLGANMINDISGGSIDNKMFDLIAEANAPYVLMHMQGIPGTMQDSPSYDNVVFDILQYLITLNRSLRNKGSYQIVIDPGFGFGKTIRHNYRLLENLDVYQILDCPILVGLSRKSMIYNVLNTSAEQALNGTTALHMLALEKGAKILRVHDVKEAKETILLHNEFAKNKNTE